LEQSERLCDGTFVDPSLRERRTDLLYSVKLGGHDAFIHLVLEHQSTSLIIMPLRMLGYVTRVYERVHDQQDGTSSAWSTGPSCCADCAVRPVGSPL
jgi:predicted transposase YdaD